MIIFPATLFTACMCCVHPASCCLQCCGYPIQQGATLSRAAVHVCKHNDMADMERIMIMVEEEAKKENPAALVLVRCRAGRVVAAKLEGNQPESPVSYANAVDVGCCCMGGFCPVCLNCYSLMPNALPRC
eukprot:1159014-Pelagomonas_calceolata.AAC.7